uniref:Uncharacterized protein n=1 Tax=viral metagenome TaxID=1070528 RepID=A0A6C0I8A0_9ZZZZ
MNKYLPLILIALIAAVVILTKSSFNDTISGGPITKTEYPMKLPPLSSPTKIPLNIPPPGDIPLAKPVVREETGFANIYPTGSGYSMSKKDSNSFYPTKPGPLLTNYSIPSAYAESNLANRGDSGNGRIIRIKNTGNQTNFKPTDEAEPLVYSAAYQNSEVQNGLALINGTIGIPYGDNYKPEDNLKLESSPGQMSPVDNCEITYPNTVKYKNLCITEGDIPYGKVVDNKVNPRLVSRWESYTGDYNRQAALNPIDGTLYPTLNVLS